MSTIAEIPIHGINLRNDFEGFNHFAIFKFKNLHSKK